jgi:hypothetical protein
MTRPKRGWFHALFKCPTWKWCWWHGRGWYICPVCKIGTWCYYDGHDCVDCGSLGVCDNCVNLCCLVTDPEGRERGGL